MAFYDLMYLTYLIVKSLRNRECRAYQTAFGEGGHVLSEEGAGFEKSEFLRRRKFVDELPEILFAVDGFVNAFADFVEQVTFGGSGFEQGAHDAQSRAFILQFDFDFKFVGVAGVPDFHGGIARWNRFKRLPERRFLRGSGSCCEQWEMGNGKWGIENGELRIVNCKL